MGINPALKTLPKDIRDQRWTTTTKLSTIGSLQYFYFNEGIARFQSQRRRTQKLYPLCQAESALHLRPIRMWEKPFYRPLYEEVQGRTSIQKGGNSQNWEEWSIRWWIRWPKSQKITRSHHGITWQNLR